jgi:DNA-binding GntR family transcriptional regulator
VLPTAGSHFQSAIAEAWLHETQGMNLDNLDRLEPRTLKENVTDILRRSIVDGALPPGIEFNQAQIAERLGISRGPIREALAQLEQEGLIESTPYKGVVVTRLTRRYVEELFSVRTALETLAIERAIDRLTPQNLLALNQIVDEMRRAAQANDLTRLVDLDLAFHGQILTMADHQLAFKLWKVVEVGVRRSLRIRHEIYTLLDEVVGSHPTLVAALEAKDKALAIRILHDHISESLTNMLANLPPETLAERPTEAGEQPPALQSAEVATLTE